MNCLSPEQKAWHTTKRLLNKQLMPGAMLWIEPVRCAGTVNGKLMLEGPVWATKWVRRRYAKVIEETICRETGFTGINIREMK